MTIWVTPCARARSMIAIEDRDDALGAFQREALGAQELGLQELLEHLRLGDLGQQVQLLGAGEAGPGCGWTRCAAAASRASRGLWMWARLDADVAAVGLLQQVEQLAQLDRAAVGDALGLDQVVEVGVGQAVVLEAHAVVAAVDQAQRIQGRRQVAHLAVVLDQAAHPLARHRPPGGDRGQLGGQQVVGAFPPTGAPHIGQRPGQHRGRRDQRGRPRRGRAVQRQGTMAAIGGRRRDGPGACAAVAVATAVDGPLTVAMAHCRFLV